MISVSVIIPTYNGADTLGDCLAALAKQEFDFALMEVIVVVDGSTDGTESLLMEVSVPFELTCFSVSNQGAGPARNLGAGKAKGNVLIFLDDDITAAPRLVSEHVGAHGASSDIVALGKLVLETAESPDWYSRCFAEAWNLRFQQLEVRAPNWTDAYSGNFSILRHNFFANDGFSEHLRFGEDVEFGHRLVRSGLKLVFLPEAQGVHVEQYRKQALIDRSYEQGRAMVAIARQSHAALVELSRDYHAARASRRLWFEFLSTMRVCAKVFSPVRYLIPGRSFQARLFRFIQKYSMWRGVRRAIDDGSEFGWKNFSRGIPILMYHAYSQHGEGSGRFVIDADRFEKQMAWIAENGYTVVNIVDLMALRRGTTLLDKKYLAITIDDAYADVISVAHPILARFGFTATIFVVTERVGEVNDWDDEAALSGRALMSWQQIAQLQREGYDIAPHTMSHQRLTNLDNDALHAEIEGSRAAIQEQFGVVPGVFAYPYGDHNSAVRAAVQAAGFEAACTADEGFHHPGADDFAIKRLEVRGNRSFFAFQTRLMLDAGRYLPRRMHKLVRLFK